MYCAVYKSTKKEASYLYIKEKDVFIDIPTPLLDVFGVPQFVMMINLDKRNSLAIVDIAKVRDSLNTVGFYLQLPPPLDATLHHIRIKNTKL